MNESSSFPGTFPFRGAGRPTATRPLGTPELARREDFRLAAATVKPSLRTIEGPDGSATAEPRVMQVLMALVDARGEVLTRDDLIRMCWGGQIVGDDAINRAISEVRRLARETGGGFGVETIPRIGYRLQGEVEGIEPTEPDAAEAAPALGLSRRGVVAGGLAIAGIAAAGYWFTRSSAPDPAARLIADARTELDTGMPDANIRAIGMLDRATKLAPGNAEGWGLLALAVALVDEHAIDRTKFPVQRVTNAAERALRIDAGNADAQSALVLSTPYYGDWLTAEKRFDAVLRQHPDHLETLDSRSFFLGAVGRMRESGLERAKFAARGRLNPMLRYREVFALTFLGRIEDADRVATDGLQMWPRHPGLWFAKLWLLANTNRLDRAIAHIRDAKERPADLPPPMVGTLDLAFTAANSGDAAARAQAARQIIGGITQSVAAVVNGVMLLNLIGAVDEAFLLSEAYYLEQGPLLPAMTWRPGQPFVPDQRRRKTNMLFVEVARPMRQDPRFMPLMKRIGLADYWDKRGITPDFLTADRG